MKDKHEQDAPQPRRPDGATPVVREVQCKTVLNKSTISDYSLNCYTGCAHGCVYCYARFMLRFHPHEEAWGDFVDVKTNAPEALERQLRRARPGHVFVSSACDAWQPIEQKYGLTRECSRQLLERGFRVNALTKSSLILRDLDTFAGRNTRIGVTITALDDRLQKLWEPRASSTEERLRVLDGAAEAGLETAIMFGPLLPFLSDNLASVEALLELAAERDVDVIWVDALNPRPKVWGSVRTLPQHDFPDLVERYRRVLFSKPVRAAYTKALHDRITRAAEKLRITDRIAGCP